MDLAPAPAPGIVNPMHAFLWPATMPVTIALGLVVPWFRFHVALITTVFGISRRRSAMAFVLIALPMFAVYDSLL